MTGGAGLGVGDHAAHAGALGPMGGTWLGESAGWDRCCFVHSRGPHETMRCGTRNGRPCSSRGPARHRDELCDAFGIPAAERRDPDGAHPASLPRWASSPQHLLGDWSLAACGQERRLFLARDHLGVTVCSISGGPIFCLRLRPRGTAGAAECRHWMNPLCALPRHRARDHDHTAWENVRTLLRRIAAVTAKVCGPNATGGSRTHRWCASARTRIHRRFLDLYRRRCAAAAELRRWGHAQRRSGLWLRAALAAEACERQRTADGFHSVPCIRPASGSGLADEWPWRTRWRSWTTSSTFRRRTTTRWPRWCAARSIPADARGQSILDSRLYAAAQMRGLVWCEGSWATADFVERRPDYIFYYSLGDWDAGEARWPWRCEWTLLAGRVKSQLLGPCSVILAASRRCCDRRTVVGDLGGPAAFARRMSCARRGKSS